MLIRVTLWSKQTKMIKESTWNNIYEQYRHQQYPRINEKKWDLADMIQQVAIDRSQDVLTVTERRKEYVSSDTNKCLGIEMGNCGKFLNCFDSFGWGEKQHQEQLI